MGSSTGIANDTQTLNEEDHTPEWEWWFPFTREDNFS